MRLRLPLRYGFASGPPILEHAGKHPSENMKVERLDQEIRRTFAHRGSDDGHVVEGRHQDDIDVRRSPADLTEERQAVHPRHLDVEDGEVGLELADELHRLVATARLADDLVALFLEGFLEI